MANSPNSPIACAMPLPYWSRPWTDKRGAFSLGCAVILLWGASALASTWVSMGIDELLLHADVVVRGRVVRQNAAWLERDGPSRIVTFYELEIQEALYGALADEENQQKRIRFGVPGGEVGDIGQYVHGAPQLRIGDEIVAFLGAGAGPGGARGVLGLNQGILRVGEHGPGAAVGTLLPVDSAFEVAPNGVAARRDVSISLRELRRKCSARERP